MAKWCTFAQSDGRSDKARARSRKRLLFLAMVVTAVRDIEAAQLAAQCVVRTHERLVEFLRAGQTLAEIDAFVAQTLKDLDCRSAFLNYAMQGHPPFRSHSC